MPRPGNLLVPGAHAFRHKGPAGGVHVLAAIPECCLRDAVLQHVDRPCTVHNDVTAGAKAIQRPLVEPSTRAALAPMSQAAASVFAKSRPPIMTGPDLLNSAVTTFAVVPQPPTTRS